MISKGNIEKSLKAINRQFNYANKRRPADAPYLAKLAILELCGWIEMSMDDILEKNANRLLLPNVQEIARFNNNVIRNTWGFKYEKHFKRMVVALIGIIGFNKIESRITPTILGTFQAELGNLTQVRDALAHTYIKGAAAPSIDTPSVTIGRFNNIYTGLKEFEKLMRSIKKL